VLAKGQTAMFVHPSTDIWSLGVLAFELLSHVRDPNRARSPSPGVEPRSPQRIVSVYGPDGSGSGSHPGRREWPLADFLPWEGMSEAAEEARQQLGLLRRVVLDCVNRDCAQRPSAEKVLAAFENANKEVVRSRTKRRFT
jgi:serine/threonine protein kinase